MSRKGKKKGGTIKEIYKIAIDNKKDVMNLKKCKEGYMGGF